VATFEHEIIVDMLRESDRLLLDLLREVFGIDPGDVVLEKSAENFAELEPARSSADVVLLARRRAGRIEEAFVAEVQRDWKARKSRVWPHYATGLSVRLECPVTVVVLATTRGVARKASRPVSLGRNGTFTPLVIGPDDIPRITDPAIATTMPELAVLSVHAHRRRPPVEREHVGRAALIGTDTADLDEGRRQLYLDLILNWLGRAVRRSVERSMDLDKYEYRSEPFKRAFAKGKQEGRQEGLARLRNTVLAIVDARSVRLTQTQRRRVQRCGDLDQLQEWATRAATCRSADELFR
jgi:hypothetical protein